MERKRDLPWLKNWRVLPLSGICLFAGFLVGMLIFGSPWHLPPAWGDIPTWITAIATVGLLAGAIITAVYAVRTFGEQARQVALLVEENNRQANERRRAQAAAVYIGVQRAGNRLVQPAAYNASTLPVFDAEFWYSGPGGLSGPDDLGMIMPGPVGHNGQQMSYDEALRQAILTFRDADGGCWIRMPDGTLREQALPGARESVLAILNETQGIGW